MSQLSGNDRESDGFYRLSTQNSKHIAPVHENHYDHHSTFSSSVGREYYDLANGDGGKNNENNVIHVGAAETIKLSARQAYSSSSDQFMV